MNLANVYACNWKVAPLPVTHGAILNIRTRAQVFRDGVALADAGKTMVQRIMEWVAANPGRGSPEIAAGVGRPGNDAIITQVSKLARAGKLRREGPQIRYRYWVA